MREEKRQEEEVIQKIERSEEKRKEIILLTDAKPEGRFSQRVYHYGFGNPNCPKEMHHHHDIDCPEDCRG